MNEIQRFPYLESWCKSYYEKVGLKIHPSNVPVDVVLNDIMEQITMLICHEKGEVTAYDAMNERIKQLEKQINELNVQFVELESKLGQTNFQTAEDIQARWKEDNKQESAKKVKK